MKKGKGILWFVYICVLGLGFSRTTASLTRMMGLSVSAYFLLTAALVLAALLVIYLPGKLLAGRFGRRAAQSKKQRDGFYRIRPIGWVLLVLLLAALVGVRIFAAPAAGFGAGQPAYEQAAEQNPLSELSLFGLYVWLLSRGILFFAEENAVFFCNLILQTAGALFAFFGIYLLSGAFCAAAALVFVIALPVFHCSAFMADPQNLLLLLIGLLIWFGAVCLRAGERAQGKRTGALAVTAAGLVCGAFGTLHLQLVSVFLLMGGVLQRRMQRKRPAGLLILFLIAAVAAFCGLMGLGAMGNGISFRSAGEGWLHAGLSREYDALLHSPGMTDYWMTVPAYLLAFLAVFGILDGRQENGEVWILPMVFITVSELVGGAPLQEQGIRFLMLGVMAGYGLLQTAAVETELPQRAGEAALREDETVETERQIEENMQNASEEPAQAIRPGVWLENPLPVPKRHVKREMTYAFEPDPDQMFFDIPISDQDDFDL